MRRLLTVLALVATTMLAAAPAALGLYESQAHAEATSHQEKVCHDRPAGCKIAVVKLKCKGPYEGKDPLNDPQWTCLGTLVTKAENWYCLDTGITAYGKIVHSFLTPILPGTVCLGT